MIVYFFFFRMVCFLLYEEEKGRVFIIVFENLNYINVDLSKSKSKDVV